MKKTVLTLLAISLSAVSAQADDLKAAIEAGKAKYGVCGACHGITGNGQPAPGINMAPSFQESELLKADAEVTALILFKGIKKDDPAAYMGQMMMPLGATMPDKDLADLITYIRAEFGGVEELTTEEQVKEYREKHKETAQPDRAALTALAEELAKAEEG